jgi:hypothetical protein
MHHTQYSFFSKHCSRKNVTATVAPVFVTKVEVGFVFLVVCVGHFVYYYERTSTRIAPNT